MIFYFEKSSGRNLDSHYVPHLLFLIQTHYFNFVWEMNNINYNVNESLLNLKTYH
jgi:hypothetical protein